MKKRILALLCVAVMLFGLAACGAQETPSTTAAPNDDAQVTDVATTEAAPKEPVTITYWYNNGAGEQEYTDEVEAKLNEYLASNPGTEHITIDLHPSANYQTDFSLAQASGEQIDLISTPDLAFDTELVNGSFMPLDDLLAKYPAVTADLPDWFVKMGIVDGVTYMVPNYQQCSNMYYFLMPKEYLDMTDYTVEDIQKLLWAEDKDVEAFAEMLENMLLSIREKTGKDTKYLQTMLGDVRFWTHYGNEEVTINWYNYFTWDTVNQEMVYSLHSEDYQEGVLKNAEFYDKGYIPADIATMDTAPLSGKNLLNDESFICTMPGGCYGDTEMASAHFSNAYGFECVVVPCFDYWYISGKNAAGGVAVSSTCEHPEEAMLVMEMLFNSKHAEFYNTLCFGLEGTHYEVTGDKTIKTLEFEGSQGNAQCSYTYHKWRGGNTFNAMINQSSSPEMMQYFLNVINEGPDTRVSPFTGKQFDLSDLETEKSQVVAVASEFYGKDATSQLAKGSLGYEKTKTALADMLAKLDAAGVNTIIESVRDQADGFLAG